MLEVWAQLGLESPGGTFPPFWQMVLAVGWELSYTVRWNADPGLLSVFSQHELVGFLVAWKHP